ncbi:hypothetical protein [Streptomyces sp. NPDC090021]|uniref:hypothetical protein n=1 Tax=Streptomyces sp. NPDC090021 TaxID=3365919 RepID=UPI0037FFA7EA
MANLRADALHKLTTAVAAEYGTIAAEDLNVAGMLRNRPLARHIADAGFRKPPGRVAAARGRPCRAPAIEAERPPALPDTPTVVEPGRGVPSHMLCGRCHSRRPAGEARLEETLGPGEFPTNQEP